MAEKRSRRAAGEARVAILEAARRRVVAAGADGLRLTEVAREAGISHPAVLHHFGNREGLVIALAEYVTDQLKEDLLQVLEETEEGGPRFSELVNRVFEALADRGHGKLLAWALQDHASLVAPMISRTVAELVAAIQGRSVGDAPEPPLAEVQRNVLLVALAAVGDGLVGEAFAVGAGVQNDDDRRAFRAWVSDGIARMVSERQE